jgi:DNA repair protein RecN (Recombination protein N)
VLVELRVTNLGVIEDQTVVLGPGLTALTGETGAGKTLLVDAISLLTGGPAEPALVAAGAAEARIEGRFAGPPDEPSELVLTRVIPASGRSRCYADGRMVSLTQMAELGRDLVDIHGQHAHQSLLAPAAQRRALDRAAGIDTSEVEGRRRTVKDLRTARSALGGDAVERARQIDLLSYQLNEIDAADLREPSEEQSLIEDEEILADATGLVETAPAVWEAVAGDDGIADRLGAVVSATGGRRPLAGLHDRLAGLQEELTDAAAEARHVAESVEADPEKLARIGERRRVLTEMRRKYGPTLADAIAYREELRTRIAELSSHEERAAALEADLERAEKELEEASGRLNDARRAAAPGLARAVEEELRALAMPRARFAIEVGEDPSRESVTWLLAANPGQPLQPLAKVASGGELARAMLATRLVLGPKAPVRSGGGATGGETDPSTLVFDEVDAGIGGEAAVAVGRALAGLGAGHQVLVVTHLAQVAAFATSQLTVAKEVVGDGAGERTVASARPVEGEARVVELARMLSGRPDSESARQHAGELLTAASGPDPSNIAPASRR